MQPITVTFNYADKLFAQEVSQFSDAPQIQVSEAISVLSTLYNHHPNRQFINSARFNEAINNVVRDSSIESYSNLILTNDAILACANAYLKSIFDMALTGIAQLNASVMKVTFTGKFNRVQFNVLFNNAPDEVVRALLELNNNDSVEMIECSAEVVMIAMTR